MRTQLAPAARVRDVDGFSPVAAEPGALPTNLMIAVRDLSRPAEIVIAREASTCPALRGAAQSLARSGSLLAQAVLEWRQAVRDRRHLASLGDRLLRDVGLSRDDVQRL